MAEAKEKVKKAKTGKQEPPKEEQQANRVHQNGVTRPAPGTRTGMVWDICDRMSKKLGAPVARKDVMAETKNCGINPATAATQYANWRKFHGITQEKAVLPTAAKAKEEKAAEPMTVEEADSEATSEVPTAPEMQESSDSHSNPAAAPGDPVPGSCVAAPVEAPAAAMCSSD